MNELDHKISILTKEYIDNLTKCTKKEEFERTIEEFHEQKIRILEENRNDISDSNLYEYVFGTKLIDEDRSYHLSIDHTYKWLILNYVGMNPDCDIELFPDYLKYNCQHAMAAIALTHINRLDWFTTVFYDENGKKHHSGKASDVRKFVNDFNLNKQSVIKGVKLSDSAGQLYIIEKWFKTYKQDVYIYEIYRLCFSLNEFIRELSNNGCVFEEKSLCEILVSEGKVSFDETNKLVVPRLEDSGVIKLSFDRNELDIENILSLQAETEIEQNEILVKSARVATRDREKLSEYYLKNMPIFYISDIHICNILQKKKANSYEKIVDVISGIVSEIKDSYDNLRRDIHTLHLGDYIVFGGDISSNRYVFELFLYELKAQGIKNAIFILGNHEFWDFESLDKALEWYKQTTRKYGYICLHNELLILEERGGGKSQERLINSDYLLNTKTEHLIKLFSAARYVFLGGTAFAGCNETFNATKGIYNYCLGKDPDTARETEKTETARFNEIYNRLFDVMNERQVIICTHNPFKDWSYDAYCPNWIYVSGHTHRNERTINDKVRLYADNQVGYSGSAIRLKYFAAETKNSYFSFYEDGIHEISGDEYQTFMDGRNIRMSLNYRDNRIFMLKKHGYYLFMDYKKTKKNGLVVAVFDGGRKKRVPRNSIEYYWDNMDKVIEIIEGPIVEFHDILSKVSDYVKSFGGTGKIHGCIVDIDFYNHIYTNPYDCKVTPYFTNGVCDRLVYKDIGKMLEKHCPGIYEKYKNAVAGNRINELVEFSKVREELAYDEGTHIYKESNAIKRFDLLRTDHILTDWIDIETV